MKKVIIGLLGFLVVAGSVAMKKDDLLWVNQQKKLFQQSLAEAEKTVAEVKKRFPGRYDQIKALALLQLDTPYKLFCLGEEKEPDTDPLFRLDCTDCAVLVMVTTALLHGKDLADAKNQMPAINYRPIEISLESVADNNSSQPTKEMRAVRYDVSYKGRLHYTMDKIYTSKYFRDITEEVAGPDKVVSQKVLLNKTGSDGKRVVNIDWEKEITFKYIPNKFITKELLKKAPPSCGITFYKNSNIERGLDMSHEGLLFDGETIIHASSNKTVRKVIKLDFMDFYFGKDNSGYDGIVLFEIR